MENAGEVRFIAENPYTTFIRIMDEYPDKRP
jgi:hypothetical protein